MIKTLTASCAAVLALATLATPANAASFHRPVIAIEGDDVIEKVGHRHGFYVVRGVYYYNGYRGILVARPGYRFYRGYWFPPAAFAAGVVVGGAIARPVAPARRLIAAHIQWCFDHYRSYRAYDNTYQPINGPREQCWSPYN